MEQLRGLNLLLSGSKDFGETLGFGVTASKAPRTGDVEGVGCNFGDDKYFLEPKC